MQISIAQNAEELNGLKCIGLLNSLHRNPSSKKVEDPTIGLYENLKLIVPSLGDLSKATELSPIQKLEMEENKKELLKLGLTEAMNKITRVERFEINGKTLDVFIYPNGNVHHMTNPKKGESPEAKHLVSVTDCKIND